MAEFEGLDPKSERDEIRDIISALSQGNEGEDKLEKDISDIKSNVDVIVSKTLSGPSKEEREENARQEKNNANFLATLLAQKLAGIFGKQLQALSEIAKNTRPLTEDGFTIPGKGALAGSAVVASEVGRPLGAAKAIKDSRSIRVAFIRGVKNPLIRLFRSIGNISFGRSGDSIRVRLISLRTQFTEFFNRLNTKFFGDGKNTLFARIERFFGNISRAFGPSGRIGRLFAEGGVFAGVSNLFKNVGGILGKFKPFFRSIFRLVPFLGQLLIAFDAITGFIKGFTAEDGGFLKGIRQAFASVLEGLTFGLLSEEGVMGFFDKVIDGLSGFFTKVFEFFTITLPNVFSKVKNFFIKTLPDFFSVTLPGFIKLGVAEASFFFTDTIPTAFSNLVDRVKIMVNNVTAMLMDGAASIIEGFNDKISGIPFLKNLTIGGTEALRGGAAASRNLSANLENQILDRTAATQGRIANIRRDITSEMERKMEARERVFDARLRAERESGSGASTVIVQNSTTPVNNNFALESTPSPVSADMEAAAYAMQGIAYGGR
jgi:hypothetical protein|tara:strand:- start:7386 stop:9023 length:1638 start_codon:yes stop_codon:yes gene_type:complete